MRRRNPPSITLLSFALLLLALYAVPTTAQSQTNPTHKADVQRVDLVGGVFEDGLNHFAIADAHISLEGGDLHTDSDAEGTFILRDVPTGPIVLLIQAPGYEPAAFSLNLDPPADQPFSFSLTREDNPEGSEPLTVTVVDTHTRTETASTTRLTRREMDASPRRNAEELLRQIPGFTLVQHGSEGKGHQFFLRGFDAVHGADLEITLHGMLINEWSNIHAQGYLDLGMIIPELVESVVVTKGPFTLRQGAFAMAGSADYNLGVAPQNRGAHIAYTAGTTNRQRLFASYSPQDTSSRDFIGFEAVTDDGYGQNRAIQRTTANSRLNLIQSSTYGQLDALALANYASFELPTPLRNSDVRQGRVGFYDAYDPHSNGRSARGLFSLLYTRSTDTSTTSATAHVGYRRLDLLENFTGFLINPTDGDRRDQTQDTLTFGLSTQHNTPLTQTLALRLGLGIHGDLFDQREDTIGRNLETLSTRRDLNGLQTITHGHTGLRWTPTPTLHIDAGARYDLVHVDATDNLTAQDGNGTLFVASPRFTARWNTTDALRLFTAYGRGLRPPEARAFTGFDAGRTGISDEALSNIQPSMTVSDAVELGLRWDPSMWFGMSASAFGTWIERESLFDHVSGTSLELNGTQRIGAEFVLYSDPLPWLSLRADATVTDATFVESGNLVPSVPQLVTGARAIFTHESGFQGGFRLLTVSPRPLPHGAQGQMLVMSDATAGYVHDWLRLHLEVENIFNRQLREGEYHYASRWDESQATSELPTLHTIAGAPLNARLTLSATF